MSAATTVKLQMPRKLWNNELGIK